jgi:Di-haem cytochrome c peroxidase
MSVKTSQKPKNQLIAKKLMSGFSTLWLLLAIALVFATPLLVAQAPTTFGSASGVTCPGGNVLCNGSINFMTTELFFEPETPPFSLKRGNVTWNEIEQLLDNPYAVTTGASCNDANGPVPVNFTGYPAYCTSPAFIRRPFTAIDVNIGRVPPLDVFGLNFNPSTGAELRMLNPKYAGTTGFVLGGVVDGQATGVCYTLGTSCTPATKTVNVTAGASRVTEREIDNTTAIGRKLPFCQTNPEPVPLGGVDVATGLPFGGAFTTAFDSENLTACGSDPGEPGGFSRANDNTNLMQCRTGVLAGGNANHAGPLCEDNVGVPWIGLNASTWYSVPAVPAPNQQTAGDMQIPGGAFNNQTTGTSIPVTTFPGNYLQDPMTGAGIPARDPITGTGGLNKPSLRTAPACTTGSCGINPNYLANACPAGSSSSSCDNIPTLPSNENDYIGLFPGTGVNASNYNTQKQAARLEAMVLGKSLFWDMQGGSDGVQSCGSCHAHAGADNRTKNQINPVGQHGISGPPTNFNTNLADPAAFDIFPPNYDLQQKDFPFLKLTDPEIAGDPLCNPPLVANVAGISFPDGDPPDNPKSPSTFTVCDSANRTRDTDNVASSMGVHFGRFYDIPAGTGTGLTNPPGPTSPFGPASHGVRALIRDQRSPVAADNIDPIAGFAGSGGPTGANQFRRVEPRNTPTVFLADENFDNFWDGRARHDDNGNSVFGAADPQAHVFVDQGSGLTATRQRIRFSSVASLAHGPTLSKFEMSFDGRNWGKVGKKLLQAGVTPLANQLVDPTDSILGRYSNQNGSACAGLPAAERSPYQSTPTTLGAGVPGLCISYPALIQHAFYSALHSNTTQHLNGCFTDGRTDIHPNQCGTGSNPAASISVLENGSIVQHNKDPFDDYVLSIGGGAATSTDTNQFTQMEANFALFWGSRFISGSRSWCRTIHRPTSSWTRIRTLE